ncbi:hypothetical protein Dimus_001765 [Dionaea muscipula]
MNENGLSNVMEIIKRQKWENLFKRRELVHVDAVKEFYAKMTVIHLKKKDIVKSKDNGIWWIGSGENRRRDDDEATQEEEAEGEDEGNQDDFDWEAVIDEATVEGESGSGEKFYDAEEEAQGSPELPDEIPAEATPSSAQREDKEPSGVDPSGPTSERCLNLRSSERDLKEKGPTGFMTIWRRPKQKMPDF